ncbi:restriction endonuclease PLD domain-containing protein [Limosilactobacillus mucosae]|uniref:restriction endonuclease PLD domain-containing protein n=1 Tax=Limosilactobacillus mucosae TaxID=97478 RepID=UPI00233E9E11|nr:restriction endonuclease PLD domain-containing protein [Limosilactobacillus mucosae]MDC2842287.1 NgoFVII family restriction endonuclease [Limosilactobacillus mucosae]
MSILYTNVPPMVKPSDKKSIRDTFEEILAQSDKLEVAVGYVSVKGLQRIDELVEKYKIKDIKLACGMYSVDGLPESIKNEIIRLHEKWRGVGIGEIYVVKNMDYHGKLYNFWKDGKPFRSIVGSANLGALAPTGRTMRQYELANTIEDKKENQDLADFIDDLIKKCCVSADNMDGIKVVHERINSLDAIEGVSELTESSVEQFNNKENGIVLRIPIKAPKFANRFSTDRKDYASSNINVCYGKGRKGKNGKYTLRNWFETQITVSADIIRDPNYPKEKPFFVVTDDGYMFEAVTQGSNNKQLSAYGDEKKFGRWIKGRLVAAGLLKAFDDADQDPDRLGVVTEEMLERSNMKVLELHKTNEKRLGKVYARNERNRLDKKHSTEEPLDVWTIHFSN